jgi:integral membrane sensor domain MASE1
MFQIEAVFASIRILCLIFWAAVTLAPGPVHPKWILLSSLGIYIACSIGFFGGKEPFLVALSFVGVSTSAAQVGMVLRDWKAVEKSKRETEEWKRMVVGQKAQDGKLNRGGP